MAGPPRYIPPDVQARRAEEYARATNRYQIDRLIEKHHREDLERERQERAEAVELRELRARVATLERGLAATVKNFRSVRSAIGMGRPPLDDGAPGDFVSSTLKAVEHLIDRIEKLEARAPVPVPLPDMADVERGPPVRYRGVWSVGTGYQPGDAVTWRGAAWVATIAARGLSPGEGAAWGLMAKSDTAELRRAVRDEVRKQLLEKGR